ncbi:MAG: 50S ribosomal protein L32 [Candidatus Zixiibacteriota bacterium]|nr:MAG: 50S ribosomal protein L32 [candidate division Zixibacteria bacterium]
MPVPKRRQSTTRRDKRRTHFKLVAATVMACPSCGEAKQPHRVCPNCGFYRKRKVIVPKEA